MAVAMGIAPEAAAAAWPDLAGRCADCGEAILLPAFYGRCKACASAHTAFTRALWARVKANAPARQQARRVAAGVPTATELARRYGGDAVAVAEGVGARVQWGDAAVMRSRAKPIDGCSLRNPLRPEGPHMIVIANDLRGGEFDLVLMHEVAHIVLPAGATEDECDAFALEFMLARQFAGRAAGS